MSKEYIVITDWCILRERVEVNKDRDHPVGLNVQFDISVSSRADKRKFKPLNDPTESRKASHPILLTELNTRS